MLQSMDCYPLEECVLLFLCFHSNAVSRFHSISFTTICAVCFYDVQCLMRCASNPPVYVRYTIFHIYRHYTEKLSIVVCALDSDSLLLVDVYAYGIINSYCSIINSTFSEMNVCVCICVWMKGVSIKRCSNFVWFCTIK